MLDHVDPTQIEIFLEAMVAKFAPGAVAMIEPAPEPNAPTAPEPAPDAPTGDEDADVVDVSVTSDPEPIAPTAPEPAPDMDIEQALAKMPLPSLRSLAKAKSVDARGTRANIARRLKALVTEFDIRALG
jgi:hypothetical protein